MAVSSYPTNITNVSTDIEVVGGKNATKGMIREDQDGRKFILEKANSTITSGTICSRAAGSDLAEASAASLVALGVNTTGKDVTVGQYFWFQIFGQATILTDETVANNQFVIATTGGVGDGISSPDSQFWVGIALADDVGTAGSVFINPGGGYKST